MFQYIFVFVWSRARVINVEIKCWFSLIFSFFGPVNKNEWPISRPIYVNTKLKCFNNPAPCLWIQRQASDRIKCMARGLFRTIYQNVMHCAEDTQQPPPGRGCTRGKLVNKTAAYYKTNPRWSRAFLWMLIPPTGSSNTKFVYLSTISLLRLRF